MEETLNQQDAILGNAAKLLENVPTFFKAYSNFLTNMMQDNFRATRDFYAKMPGASTSTCTDKSKDDCCPPKPACPPRCLAEIVREACVGEVIVVPFSIKNKCNTAKDYKVGIRPLVDQNGTTAPVQPYLNVDAVHLEAGQSITVLMTVNLLQGFETGNIYSTEIVIREDAINQNICFQLTVKPCGKGVEACPLDEREYLLRWQSWQEHFYCEQKPGTNSTRPNIQG